MEFQIYRDIFVRYTQGWDETQSIALSIESLQLCFGQFENSEQYAQVVWVDNDAMFSGWELEPDRIRQMAFAKADGKLRLFELFLPEFSIEMPPYVAAMALIESVQPIRATLWLNLKKGEGFGFEPALSDLYFDRQMNRLVAMKTSISWTEPITRLSVHPSFELLFHGQHWFGWVLHRPALYLNNEYSTDFVISSAHFEEISQLFGEYLDFTREKNFEQLHLKDSAAYHRFKSLQARVATFTPTNGNARALAEGLENLLETWG
jgi:hypothetical protein